MALRIRKNVWSLTQPWDDTLLWYAKAVGKLQKSEISTLTSWKSLGAMHGFDRDYWISLGLLDAEETLPDAAIQARYWKQCQHASWFFLPWHRGYLAAFESIIAATIKQLGGPDDWALPYWNYNDNDTRRMPAAFSEKVLPDANNAPNPLFVPLRFGNTPEGDVVIPPTTPGTPVNLDALTRTRFEATASTGSPGFGGLRTPFHHDSQDGPSISGGLERMPHNFIHGQIGGGSRDAQGDPIPGLMSDPDLAALDPIFWIHHANIDRLWEVWLHRNPLFKNPNDETWLDGPADRKFAMVKADGSDWPFAARDMIDTTSA